MECEIVKDLMPLYIENLTSGSSSHFIEEHIKSCDSCRQRLSDLKTEVYTAHEGEELEEKEKLPKLLVERVKKSIYEKVAIAVAITLIIGVTIGVFSSDIFMFMAFLGSISILAFGGAILLSYAICRRKTPLKKQFRALGNWTFLLSVGISSLFFIIFAWYFNDGGKMMLLLMIELLYNIIFSASLRLYARFRLPKEAQDHTKATDRKKLITVSFVTFIAISTMIALPTALLEKNRIVDNIDLPYVEDAAVIGSWVAVDFVREQEQFKADDRYWEGSLYLEELIFMEDGLMKGIYENSKNNQSRVVPNPWLAWTKGYVLHKGGDHTASKYEIREINGSTYMFYEWKSGDYVYFHQKPYYYVLKKQ